METPQTDIEVYRPIVADLAQLKQQLAGVAYDLTTKQGEEAARTDRRLCVTMRTLLEDRRVALKKPLLEAQRAIDADARTIEAAIREVEKPIDDQIKALEAKRESEAEAKRQAIAQRLAEIRALILSSFAPPRPKPGQRMTSSAYRTEHARIEDIPVDERFGDLKLEAQEAKVAALEWLAAGLADALAFEAEQVRLDAERAAIAEAKRQQRLEDEERRQRQQREDDERARIRAEEDLARANDARALAEALAGAQRLQAEQLAAQRQREADAAPPPNGAEPVSVPGEPLVRGEIRIDDLEALAEAMASRDLLPEVSFDEVLVCLTLWQRSEHEADENILAAARSERDRILAMMIPTLKDPA